MASGEPKATLLTSMIKILFICLLLLGFYCTFIYPLVLLAVRKYQRKALQQDIIVKSRNSKPTVSFIVPVYNGAAYVEQKILNTLAMTYDRSHIEFIFISDGSTDHTVDIIKQYPEIILVELAENRGKEVAIKAGVNKAQGEFIVFSDTTILVNPDAVNQLITTFDDSSVGAVSSVDKFVGTSFSLKSLYIQYEMKLRAIEAQACSCVGVSGSLFAARSHLCKLLDADFCSDLHISFICIENGYRTVISELAVGEYQSTSTNQGEFARLRRTFAHGIMTIVGNLRFINPFVHGLFSYQVISHKALRWLAVIVFLITAVMVSIEVASQVNGTGQLVGFISSSLVIGYLLRKQILEAVLICSALTSAVALLLYGKRFNTWNPTKRKI